MQFPDPPVVERSALHIPAGRARLDADFAQPDAPRGLVVFAHGSGSSRSSPRNREIADRLNEAHIATLLADLLTADEAAIDERTRHLRFDIGLLAERVAGLVHWLREHAVVGNLPIGLFGASTGAAAALVAAAELPADVVAVVSRGGRPDLAGDALPEVRCPVLLLVGGRDDIVLELNEQALEELGSREKELVVVPGATHLFEEPGTLDAVAGHAAEWFATYLLAERR